MSVAPADAHEAAEAALQHTLDFLQPAVAAILAHVLGATWDCTLDPPPPWRQPADMLLAMRPAKDSVALRQDARDFEVML